MSPDGLRVTIAQGAFLPVPPVHGGAVEKAWFALGQEMSRLGHSVCHVSRHYVGWPDQDTIEGVQHLRVQGYESPRSLIRLKLLDLFYSLRVRRVLPEADILVTNTFWLPLIEKRRSRGRPFVFVARHPKGQLKYYPRDVVFQAPSNPVRDAIFQELPGARDRVAVVPYPVHPKYCVPLRQERERTILYAGRVHPAKGVHLLLGAFAQAMNDAAGGTWTLRIVGPWRTEEGGGGESYLRSLQAMAKGLDGRVTLVEPIFDEDRLAAEYRSASLFVYPSLGEKAESSSLAVLEAMASGCVPIVSELACFHDIVRDGLTGLFFDQRAPDATDRLRSRMVELINAPDRLAELRQAAWNQSRQYTLDRVTRQLITDFRRLPLQGRATKNRATSVHASSVQRA